MNYLLAILWCTIIRPAWGSIYPWYRTCLKNNLATHQTFEFIWLDIYMDIFASGSRFQIHQNHNFVNCLIPLSKISFVTNHSWFFVKMWIWHFFCNQNNFAFWQLTWDQSLWKSSVYFSNKNALSQKEYVSIKFLFSLF